VIEFTVDESSSDQIVASFDPGAVEFTSSPAGAQVWQDGIRQGLAPIRIEDLSPGIKVFEIRLE
jgi:hypothetical protein